MRNADRFRELSGIPGVLASAGMAILPVLGLAWAVEAHRWVGFNPFSQQYLATFLGLATALAFMIAKPVSRPGNDLPWYDALAALMSLGFGLYVLIVFPEIAYTLTVATWDKILFGAAAILLILEATRRLFGWTLVILAGVLCLYTHYGYILPGLLYTRGESWERIATYLFLDSNGIFGIALTVTAMIVVGFIVFGRTLQVIGGGAFFTDLAMALLGGSRGGPAKVSVISSTLFGTMSGSVVSNVVVSGSMTIPLMKKYGYTPHFASATEAASSTGGQIMPPVMGIAAFIIAENLGVPYGEIALAALIPALLYYGALFLQVDLEARRRGLPALEKDMRPKLSTVVLRGWPFLLPLAVLIYTLVFAFWNAGRAGVAAAATAFVIGLILTPAVRHPRAIYGILRDCGRLLIDITVVSALAGIVIGTLHLSGLSFTLSMMLATLAEYGLLLLLVVTAAVCILFGMGMPTTVVYVMLAIMVAPALVDFGVTPIAAHLFIFYFGMLSMLTPPVCMATITAASMGAAPFWKTAWTGVRLGIVAYVVPFFFVFHPQLLLQDFDLTVLLDLAAVGAGILLVSIAAAGHLRRDLGPALRLGLAIGGLCLAAPATSPLTVAITAIGLILGAVTFIMAAIPGRAHDSLVASRK